MIFFLTTIFFLTLFFFGWQTARFVLHENKIERLIAFSGIFGIGLYVFFINALGFFVPIQKAFYAVFFSFLLLAFGSLFWRRFRIVDDQTHLEWGVNKKWRRILLFFTLFLIVSTGFISFRHPMDLFTLREPTAMTIAEGNFPPREIWSPDNFLRYHYAPDLLSAAIYKVTGMPLYIAYDFQKAILSGTLFLLAFIFINSIFSSAFVAFWSALLMLYSGSLVFLKGLGGIPVLFDKFVLGKEIIVPFKFVTDAIGEESGLPVINYLVHLHWGAMAFALMIAVIYIYFHLLNRNKSDNYYWPAVFVAGFMLALLALVAESFFVVVVAVLLVFPFILFFFRKNREILKNYFITSFFILLIAVPIAILQGGVLKGAIYQQLRIEGNKDEIMLYTNEKFDSAPLQFGTPLTLYDGKPIYDIDFMVKWVLLFVVLVPAFISLFKQRFKLAIFLASLIILFFGIPFLFYSDFPFINGNLGRFFYPINLLGGMVVGLFLSVLYLQVRKPSYKYIIVFFTIILMAQGLWTHFIWFSFGYPPGVHWNPNSMFFAKTATFEADAYKWVKKNTNIKDRFLIIKDEYSECGFSGAPNCFFIFNTGRMAPIFRWHQAIRIEDKKASYKIDQFDMIRKDCNSVAIQELKFNYLYVDEHWSNGIEKKCLENNKLNLVFEKENENKFIRIYKI